MYMNENCKILQKQYDNNYKYAFQGYFIQCVYGENIMMGNELLKDDKNGE